MYYSTNTIEAVLENIIAILQSIFELTKYFQTKPFPRFLSNEFWSVIVYAGLFMIIKKK